MMIWYGGHWAFWQASLMWIGMLLFWALLIWAVYALIRNITGGPQHDKEREGQARRILDQRLARGDIDAEEYQRLRDLIASGDRQARTETGSPR